MGKAPAMRYAWQFYLRRVMYDPKFIKTVAELLAERIDLSQVQVGACEDAGVPLGCALSALSGVPMLSIKKTRKAYGLLNFTEGPITGKPIMLVDDIAGSQNTLRQAKYILEAYRLPIHKQYATIVSKTQGTHDTYLNENELVHLLTCEDFAMKYVDYVAKYGKNPDFGLMC